jgi:ribonuclease HII
MLPIENYNNFYSPIVIGIDEAGRGPLAGPVVAAGVVLDQEKPIDGLRDSKKLSEKARESLYEIILQRALVISVKAVDVKVIDKINILQATFKAMGKVLSSLKKKPDHGIELALIDGNRTVPGFDGIKQRAITKGDSSIKCIMAASIVAKVHRDRLMRKYGEEYPGYGFHKHKGYGTHEHMQAIFRLGPCPIHRRSFSPVKDMYR